jgi:hypothetical protein
VAGPHRGTARVAAVTAAPGAANTRRQVPATPALVMAIGLVKAVHLRLVAAQVPPGEGPVAPEDKAAVVPAQEWVAGGRALARQEVLGHGRRPVLVPERPGLARFRVAVLTLLTGRLRASRHTEPVPAALVVAQVGVAGLDGPVASAVALVGAAAPAATGARGAGSGAGKN